MIVHGPPVTAIGWIPYHPLWGGHIPNAYKRHPRRFGLKMMLRTGNRPEPPVVFSGRRAYRAFVDTRNFRAAMCLTNVRLICDPTQATADIEADAEDFIGYTPMQARGRFGKITYDLAWHEKGEGEVRKTIERGPTWATLRRTVFFRIGKLGNLGSAILTGYWAPYVWMSIDYTIWCSGNIRVDFCGSLIPSQSLYADWRRIRRHSMKTLTTGQIDGFLTAGADLPAPGRSHLVLV